MLVKPWTFCFTVSLLCGGVAAAQSKPFQPVVEVDEEVYSYESADNGAGPMWCHGSTCVVRVGETVFASGLETLSGAKPLNNCVPLLFRRGDAR